MKLYSILHSTEFEHVFLHNPSSESTFAQYQSCRSSCPLQLLFWPNFRFQYEIWSFGWSNFGQNQFKLVQLGYCALQLHRTRAHAVDRQQRRRRHASAVGEPRPPRSHARPYPLPPEPCPFSPSLSPSSRAGRAELPPVPIPATPRRRASIPRSPSRPTSPRVSSAAFLSSIDPLLGRIDPCATGHHRRLRRSLALAIDDPLPTSLRSNRVAGELPRVPLSLPNPIPARIPHRRRWTTAAPP